MTPPWTRIAGLSLLVGIVGCGMGGHRLRDASVHDEPIVPSGRPVARGAVLRLTATVGGGIMEPPGSLARLVRDKVRDANLFRELPEKTGTPQPVQLLFAVDERYDRNLPSNLSKLLVNVVTLGLVGWALPLFDSFEADIRIEAIRADGAKRVYFGAGSGRVRCYYDKATCRPRVAIRELEGRLLNRLMRQMLAEADFYRTAPTAAQ